MAKARLAIVAKQPATPGSECKGAPENIALPDPVQHVLYEIQQRMFQINAVIAGIHALAEAKECDSDVRWALEGVLGCFEPLLDDDLARIVMTRAITVTASKRVEVSDGR